MAKKKSKPKDLWYDIIKPFGKKVAKTAKKAGVGVGKEEWEAGKPARKAAKARKKAARIKALTAKRKALKAERAKKAGPLVKAPKYKGAPLAPKSKKKVAAKPVEQKFGKAFSSARKAGKKTFTWKGKSYTTKTADDVKKEKVAKPKSKESYYYEKGKHPSGPTKADKKATRVKAKTETDIPSIPNRPEKQMGGMVQPPAPPEASPSIQPPQASYDKGGKVESNPFGWPSRDARSGFGKKK